MDLLEPYPAESTLLEERVRGSTDSQMDRLSAERLESTERFFEKIQDRDATINTDELMSEESIPAETKNLCDGVDFPIT